jgi:hypothetical protein
MSLNVMTRTPNTDAPLIRIRLTKSSGSLLNITLRLDLHYLVDFILQRFPCVNTGKRSAGPDVRLFHHSNLSQNTLND